MKMTKTLLFGAALLALASFGFMACSEDDDDEYDVISGSNNRYWVGEDGVGYYNDSDAIVRGYDTMTNRHAGTVVKITMNDQKSGKNDGVMGIIWDLKEADGAREFYVIGFTRNQVINGNGMGYFISKYTNVTDLQAQNFGAPTSTYEGNGATEVEIVKLGDSKTLDNYTLPADGKAEFYVDIQPTVGTDNKETGGFTVKVYDKYDSSNKTAATDATEYITAVEIPNSDTTENTTGYAYKTAYSSTVPGATIGIYANVYGGQTLSGEWNVQMTVREAEVIEE